MLIIPETQTPEREICPCCRHEECECGTAELYRYLRNQNPTRREIERERSAFWERKARQRADGDEWLARNEK